MMAGETTFPVTDTLVVETCCNCHMRFAMTQEFRRTMLEKRPKRFYCPAGHTQYYMGESDADVLRRERDRLKQQLAQRDDEITAQKREADKLRKRIARGVCPCCTRSFQNLQRHMKTKHPDYQETVQ
jgi:hypothetical protein